MQLGNVLHILLGAALVSIGVLLAALADRIKTGREMHRAAREAAPRDRTNRPQSVSTAIPVVHPADLLRSVPTIKPIRATRTESKTEGGDDVIAALVAAGYKKPIATEATWACSAGERVTIEVWTVAALRRCARGGVS